MKRLLTLIALSLFSMAFSACVQPELAPTPEAATNIPVSTISSNALPADPDWLAVEDWLYQLQHGNAKRIGETAFDLVVVSISTAGSSPQTFPALKQSSGGPKIVLCYMSIGQAEDYRSYWQSDWEEDPPPSLGPSPMRTGKEITGSTTGIRTGSASFLALQIAISDQLIDLGCDGVYLDRVDAYDYYDEQGRTEAQREMADFVIALAQYARQLSPSFGIFPAERRRMWASSFPTT